MGKRLRTQKELLALRIGDIIRHVGNGNAYVVVGNFGRELIVADVLTATNPDEWEAITIDGKRV